MKQFNLTTVMGKRLIGKGIAQHPDVQRVLQKGTLLIIAGTTNGYVAEEILTTLQAFKSRDMDWKAGKVWCYVYNPGEDPADVTKEAYLNFLTENGLDTPLS